MIALFWNFVFLCQKCELQGVSSAWATEALPCHWGFVFFCLKHEGWHIFYLCFLQISNYLWNFWDTSEIINFAKFCFPNWLDWLFFAGLTGFVSRLAKLCYYFANIVIIRRKWMLDMTIFCFHFPILFLLDYLTQLQKFFILVWANIE